MDTELARLDAEAHKILNDFVPDKVFDTHAHLYHEYFTPYHCENKPDGPFECYDWERYVQDMQLIVPGRTVHANMLPWPEKRFAVRTDLRDRSDAFTVAQLDKDPLSVGEIVVAPGDTAEALEKRLVHPRIKGLSATICWPIRRPRADLRKSSRKPMWWSKTSCHRFCNLLRVPVRFK